MSGPDESLEQGAIDVSPVVAVQQPPVEEPLIEDELIIEDISIDGMCGVY